MSERNTTQSFINQMSMVTTKPLVEREVTNIEFVNRNTGQVVLKLDKAKVSTELEYEIISPKGEIKWFTTRSILIR